MNVARFACTFAGIMQYEVHVNYLEGLIMDAY
jgi:hypothetical protein